MGVGKTEPMLFATCDGCGRHHGDEDTGTKWLFVDRDELRKSVEDSADCDAEEDGEISGWSLGQDDAVTCPECRQKAYCAQNGHTKHELPECSVDGRRMPAFVYCTVCHERLGGQP